MNRRHTVYPGDVIGGLGLMAAIIAFMLLLGTLESMWPE